MVPIVVPILTTSTSLLVVTVVTSFCADYCKSRIFFLCNPPNTVTVVASIEETAERYSIPKPFIGLILLPLVVSEVLLAAIIDSKFSRLMLQNM